MGLKALTAEINERASVALSEIEDGRVATFAISLLREKADAGAFLSWIREETYLTAWKQLAHNLNRIPSAPAGDQPLGPNLKATIKTTCDRGAQVFIDLAGPQQKAA